MDLLTFVVVMVGTVIYVILWARAIVKSHNAWLEHKRTEKERADYERESEMDR